MITISLCMIVKDEQENIRACIESVRDVVDEIVIVDTGSSDHTREIAREYTEKVYEFKWVDDFSKARNYAFSKATMEYIMWMDADDRVTEENREKFLELKEGLDKSVDAVMMKYNTAFDEQGRVLFSFFRERLLRREAGFQWNEPVHEYVVMSGKVVNSEIAVNHTKRTAAGDQEGHGDRNLRIYERQIEKGGGLTPRGMYYYARELLDHGRMKEAARQFEEFLKDGRGWVEDNIVACLELGRCYMQLQEEGKAVEALLRSFGYDTPRAEVCCRLGYLYKGKADYRRAAFWFEVTQWLKKPEGGWGFVQEDDWGYVPCIECAVCYYALGDVAKAEYYNERAGQCKPDSGAVLHNRRVFAIHHTPPPTPAPTGADGSPEGEALWQDS